MEFTKEKTLIHPLRIKEDIINELNNHFLLCYVGKSHSSGEVHTNIKNSFENNEEKILENFNRLKEISVEIRDSLLTNRLENIGRLLHESWQNKKSLNKTISNSKIDDLYEFGIKNGALGGRLLGAGDGGYILFFVTHQKRNCLVNALKTAGMEVTNFNFDLKGTQVWAVQQF